MEKLNYDCTGLPLLNGKRETQVESGSCAWEIPFVAKTHPPVSVFGNDIEVAGSCMLL